MGVKNLKQMLLAAGLGLLWWLPAGAFMAWAGENTDKLCVRPDGKGDCFATIQEAVDAAVDGDEILIAAGTYTESVIVHKSLTLTGGWQPAGWVLTETLVHAGDASCALFMDGISGRVANLTVAGALNAGFCGDDIIDITLDHFTARKNQGDGAYIDAAGSLTITHSAFNDNDGHGLDLECPYTGSSSRILVISGTQALRNGENGFDGGDLSNNCHYHYEKIVTQNNKDSGFGGFGDICPAHPDHSSFGRQSAIIIDSEIALNSTGLKSLCGALYFLSGNFFHHNGIGIFLDEASAVSINNLIVDNQESTVLIRGAATWDGTNDTLVSNNGPVFTLSDDVFPFINSVSACDTPELDLTNTIAWGNNQAVTWNYSDYCTPFIIPFYVYIKHSLISGLEMLITEQDIIYFTIGPAVYDMDPLFVGNGDYRLRAPSLAIDGGTAEDTPLVDIMGNPRPVDGNGDGSPQFDMGAYESPLLPFNPIFLPQATNQP